MCRPFILHSASPSISRLHQYPGGFEEQISSRNELQHPPPGWAEDRRAAVNYLDRQIRKDLSDHVRETVQWAKNSNDMMARLVIYQLFRNYLKPFRIRSGPGDIRTHGNVYGFDGKKIAGELEDSQALQLMTVPGLVKRDITAILSPSFVAL